MIQSEFENNLHVHLHHSAEYNRIQVRIDPPHSLMCRKRRLNGVVLLMRPDKPRPRVVAGDQLAQSPCSKVLSAEYYRPKFCCTSPVMLTSLVHMIEIS